MYNFNDVFNAVPEEAKVAMRFDAAEAVTEGAWEQMVADAQKYLSTHLGDRQIVSNGYLEYRDLCDTIVLEMREKQGEKGLRTKSGKLKLSKITKTSTYKVYKKRIAQCIEKGLPLEKDGKPYPKTELEHQVDPITTCLNAVKRIRKHWGQLSETEKGRVMTALDEMYDETVG